MKKPTLKYLATDATTGAELQQMLDHNDAIRRARGFELPLVRGLQALESYAQTYVLRYSAHVSEDGVMGEYWITWAISLRNLLDGDTGRLNCGHMHSYINDLAKYYGYTERDLQL